MFGVTRHVRVVVVIVIALASAAFPLGADAATTAASITAAPTPKLIITEVQISGASASDEFIELYNQTGSDIDLADQAGGGKDIWKLQFFSAASTANGTPDWTKPAATVSLSGIVPAHDYFVASATGYAPGGLDGDQAYAPRLSDSGGGLQVVEAVGSTVMVHDRLMWQAPAPGKVLPSGVLATPEAGSSLQRIPTDDGSYADGDGSLTMFQAASSLSPKDLWHAPVVILPEPSTDANADGSSQVSDPGQQDDGSGGAQVGMPLDNTGLQPPIITELLPNPASPLSDTTDEFIELYNPNGRPFDLKGFSLEVGTATLHDFTFDSDLALPPQGYQAFYSADTHLSLANTGGQAKLLDTGGAAVSQTDPYGTAAEGMAWAFDGSGWQWSTESTPGAANEIIIPAVASTTPKSTAPKATVAKAAPKASKPTVKAAKVTGTSKTKTKKAITAKAKKAAKPKIATVANTIAVPEKTPVHTGILVVVVVLAVLYAAYEYRHDIRNYIYGLRRNRAVRAYARQ